MRYSEVQNICNEKPVKCGSLICRGQRRKERFGKKKTNEKKTMKMDTKKEKKRKEKERKEKERECLTKAAMVQVDVDKSITDSH